uniref:non-specific serine/threonine protein kinase n=1 Tax=Oryza glumipatula TaxID=40148 RepID=A0A0E0B6R6_9ORYZ
MDLPAVAGRRTTSYSLLSQFPDDAAVLQRQSSGSSYGAGSSLSASSDFPFHLPSAAAPAAGAPGGSPCKSWAQQAEETYQLQLALALRLCADAASAADPAFLDPGHSATATATAGPFPLPPPTPSADSLSHRFWVNGSLSYSNTIPDGFYLIHGMDPFVWSLCTDLLEENRIPSIDSLKSVRPDDSSMQAILIDRRTDFDLGMLENYASSFLSSSADMKDVINQLAKLVSSRMGGTTSNEESFLPRWKECSDAIKSSTGSIVLHLGKLPIGFCKHRSLLFKMLADKVNVPCRVVKGCKYCKSDDATSCLIRFGLEREYLVDLIGDPGQLSDPDSFVNGPYSLSVPSPLRPPKFRSLEITSNFSSVAKQYFSDCHSLNLLFNEASTGANSNAAVAMDQPYSTRKHDTRDDIMSSWVPVKAYIHIMAQQSQAAVSSDAILPEAPREVLPLITSSNLKADKKKEFKLIEGNQYLRSTVSDLSLAVDDLIIPWNELILKEKIGAGSFGTVHRADWNGSDVAVKILMEQDFHPDRFREFMREVAIMKSLRHPNIVLFMGAVTEPPNLSIVTEYLSRGSLYKLLHRSGAKEVLDERRRLNMAFDVAKGMNYLHKRSPPIVHRDLKSPNLLVDKKYTVKVCDFGLSRLKANTFLSSKSLAGTPEWMAPEVLRDEPSNEKSDVYSFGVILWELMTMQQPWCNLNPAQVVAAVGFKGRRLDIPKDLNPQVAALIESCWAKSVDIPCMNIRLAKLSMRCSTSLVCILTDRDLRLAATFDKNIILFVAQFVLPVRRCNIWRTITGGTCSSVGSSETKNLDCEAEAFGVVSLGGGFRWFIVVRHCPSSIRRIRFPNPPPLPIRSRMIPQGEARCRNPGPGESSGVGVAAWLEARAMTGRRGRSWRNESLQPPAHGAAATTPWVLLDIRSFMANHRNATTATSGTRSGHPTEVSFWTAPPPRVSYICVHCPGLDPKRFATEPTIIAAEADLVLVRVAMGRRNIRFKSSFHDYYFVYQATTPTPKLTLLPPPRIDRFIDHELGLLRCCASPDYIVAALCNTFESGYFEYDLHIYRSGDDAWTCHPISLHGLVDPSFAHVNTKAITIGGTAGTMGWVDLYRGILFCDLLRDSTKFRYFPLPPPLNPNDSLTGSPRPLRDIAIVQGRIKYIEMQVHGRPGSIINGTFISQGWTAATWTAPHANPWKHGWRQDCKITASDISVDDSKMNFELLPKLFDDQGTPQPTLERLHVGHPTLSLHSDDIVCFMAKVDQWDDDAWVLAVDMKNKRIKDVAEFGAERTLGIGYAYMSSNISDYLRKAPGIKGSLKRQGVVLTVPSHKKQTRVVYPSPPSWKGGDQQDSRTSMSDGEDNMDLDLDLLFG